MKRIVTTIVLLTGIVAIIHSQNTFKVDYDGGYLDSDEAHCITATADGGYLLGGAFYIDDFSWFDAGIMKISGQGELEWTKTYGAGTFNIEVAYDIFPAADNGYMVVTGTDGISGNDDMWVIKIDENGDSLWSKVYGGEGQEYGSCGLQAADGGYLFLGTTNSYGAGFDDIYLVKTDANGNEQWHKTYGTANLETAGDIEPTSDGGYIIAGSTNGYTDGYVVKTDANGDTLWTKVIGGVFNDMFASVKQTDDGGYILTGHTIPQGAGEYDVWLVKLDADGNIEWEKTIGGDKKDEGFAVVQTLDGGFFITGLSESYHHSDDDSDLYMIKTDANGDTLWTAHFGGFYDDGGYAGFQSDDGGFVAAGYYYHPGAALNFYAVKVNAEGTLQVPGNVLFAGDKVSLFPNPAANYATIKFSNPGNSLFTLSLISIDGKIVKKITDISENSYKLDVKDLEQGIYFIHLTDKKEDYWKKIVVE